MKISKKKTFFKGTNYGYSTQITVTKGEETLIWIVTILAFCAIFGAFFLLDNVLAIILTTALAIGAVWAVLLIVLFSAKHKEERQENAQSAVSHIDDFKGEDND